LGTDADVREVAENVAPVRLGRHESGMKGLDIRAAPNVLAQAFPSPRCLIPEVVVVTETVLGAHGRRPLPRDRSQVAVGLERRQSLEGSIGVHSVEQLRLRGIVRFGGREANVRTADHDRGDHR
jgi:hypothetical protein